MASSTSGVFRKSLLGRLGGVICHFDWTRNATFEPCQRLLRCNGAKKQGGVLGDEPVPVGAALRKGGFEAASLHSVASVSSDVPLSGDRRSDLLEQSWMSVVQGVSAASGLEADRANRELSVATNELRVGWSPGPQPLPRLS
jgi:hypothetical protein